METIKIPHYYTDKKLTEEEKIAKDWEMLAGDFPFIATKELDKQ